MRDDEAVKRLTSGLMSSAEVRGPATGVRALRELASQMRRQLREAKERHPGWRDDFIEGWATTIEAAATECERQASMAASVERIQSSLQSSTFHDDSDEAIELWSMWHIVRLAIGFDVKGRKFLDFIEECRQVLRKRLPTLERAREILMETGFRVDGGDLVGGGDDTLLPGVSYHPANHSRLVDLEGTFTADQLEALAVWMRAHAK